MVYELKNPAAAFDFLKQVKMKSIMDKNFPQNLFALIKSGAYKGKERDFKNLLQIQKNRNG